VKGCAASCVKRCTPRRRGFALPRNGRSTAGAGRCARVLCGSHGGSHLMGLPKILARVCAKAGLKGVTVHVLRHSFAATAAEMGFSELTIAGLLGHSVPGITARYAHVPDLRAGSRGGPGCQPRSVRARRRYGGQRCVAPVGPRDIVDFKNPSRAIVNAF
jgi:Phage integrase family